ncbi:MAG: SGNH/GDSL hydrolase family protein, partial [Thermomicrobiales bacterium]
WWVEQFNQVIRRVAAEQSALVADIAPRFENRIDELTHYPFDIHPSNAGHLAIARAIWETLDVDRESPRITVDSEIEATRATPTVQFTVEDNVGVQSVTARSADITLRGPFQVDDNAWAILVDLTATGLAEVALTIEIGDDAGNTSLQEVTVQVSGASRSEN